MASKKQITAFNRFKASVVKELFEMMAVMDKDDFKELVEMINGEEEDIKGAMEWYSGQLTKSRKKQMKVVPDEERCTAKTKKGDRCSKRKMEGKEVCNVHMRKLESDSEKEESNKKKCNFKMTRGMRSGEECGKLCETEEDEICKAHKKVVADRKKREEEKKAKAEAESEESEEEEEEEEKVEEKVEESDDEKESDDEEEESDSEAEDDE